MAIHKARGRSLEEAGLRWGRRLRGLGLAALYAAVFLPLYAAGFLYLHGTAGWVRPGIDVFVVSLLGTFAFAALPEEVFFRGFVQPGLAAAYPGDRTRRVLRIIPLNRAVVLTAALFAVTHVSFLANPFSLAGLERLTTFFPGLLFGALREETGDVTAPALFHALCNAWLASLQLGYTP